MERRQEGVEKFQVAEEFLRVVPHGGEVATEMMTNRRWGRFNKGQKLCKFNLTLQNLFVQLPIKHFRYSALLISINNSLTNQQGN